MSNVAEKTHADFILPASVVSRRDVMRLVSEFEKIDDQLTSDSVRAKVSAKKHEKPVLSEQVSDFITQNKLDLSDARKRSALIKQLRILKEDVPVFHMTFATVADSESLQRLTKWIRTSVHPQAVIEVGIQPGLVAGVYLRTPNRVHDFSLRAMLASQHNSLVKELEALRVSK
jgi:F0F1-type ATP synthase delta subunit